MLNIRNILLVGCGNMGSALLRGWLTKGVAPGRVSVVDADISGRALADVLGVRAAASPESHAAEVQVLVLAVKPQQLEGVLEQYASVAQAGAVVLSIAAGKPIAFYEKSLGTSAAIVRAMPNSPAAIGQGITALTANAAASEEQRRVCENLMSAVGEVVWLEDERLMDAVTAVSGSGPAYVFLLIESLAAAGREAGLDEALAERLAMETVAGAGAYARQADATPAELRLQVTSPEGTTQAALDVLLGEQGLEALLKKAVHAAAARSRQLA